MKKSLLKYSSALTILVLPNAAAGESAPAVSQPNIKIDVSTGVSVGDFAVNGGLSGAIPIGHSFGLQLDGAAGSIEDSIFGGVGGHLFWRDPEFLLLGATGMWARFEDAKHNLYRTGLEAELYLNDFTLFSASGIQWDGEERSVYGSAGVGYYAMPNLVLSVQASGFDNYQNYQLGAEYRPTTLEASSFFVDTGINDDSEAFGQVGFRMSFGASSRTLKDRDRFDDPVNIVTGLMRASGKTILERTQSSSSAVVSSDGDGGCDHGGSDCC